MEYCKVPMHDFPDFEPETECKICGLKAKHLESQWQNKYIQKAIEEKKERDIEKVKGVFNDGKGKED